MTDRLDTQNKNEQELQTPQPAQNAECDAPEVNKENKPKKEDVIYVDDNRTVADMNVEGMPWYVKGGYDRKKAEKHLSFKEKMALVFGAYRAYLPGFLAVGCAFLLAFLLLKLFWS